jgi:adenylylsulfate kinase
MNGTVVWLTGLPSSGKSTLAQHVFEALHARSVPVCVLDGDAVRAAITPPFGYDDVGREQFYATLSALAVLLARQGLTVLVPATANRRVYRTRCREAAPRFLEVYVRADKATVRARDTKGLYASQERGGVSHLPGADAAYEAPTDPDVTAEGGHDQTAVASVLRALGVDRQEP